MYVRLAFAVAAHLEPDVLIADEVLAVGDSEFQRKCIGKMREVAGGGRTVIFVSHNQAAVASLCTRAIWLDSGQVRHAGSVEETASAYLHSFAADETGDLKGRTDRTGDGSLRVESIRFRDAAGHALRVLHAGDDVDVVVGYASDGTRPLRDVSVSVWIDSAIGERVATISNQYSGETLTDLAPRGDIVCRIRGLPLNEGEYSCGVKVRVQGGVADSISDAAAFRVDATRYYASRRHPTPRAGALLLQQEWHAEENVAAEAVAARR
jgi:lipopolysaccharide transport system ATP-binding protein